MTAAELTPTMVQQIGHPQDVVYGTAEVRLIEYFVKVTKAAQSDWIVPGTYGMTGTICHASGFVIDGSSDGAAETVTYTNTGTKIVLGGSATGTAYLRVLMYQ